MLQRGDVLPIVVTLYHFCRTCLIHPLLIGSLYCCCSHHDLREYFPRMVDGKEEQFTNLQTYIKVFKACFWFEPGLIIITLWHYVLGLGVCVYGYIICEIHHLLIAPSPFTGNKRSNNAKEDIQTYRLHTNIPYTVHTYKHTTYKRHTKDIQTWMTCTGSMMSYMWTWSSV